MVYNVVSVRQSISGGGVMEKLTYRCFYDQKAVDIVAKSQYAAKLAAIEHFKVRKNKKHMVSAVLSLKDGEPVTHLPLF